MTRTTARLVVLLAAVSAALVITVRAAGPQQQPPAVSLTITGEPGALPRYAVPDFIALSNDADTLDAVKTIGQVLWDDLSFEREFDMIPRDTYASIPAARSLAGIPFDRWRELGADALLIGTVEKRGDAFRVEVRLFGVKQKQAAFNREFTAATTNPRFVAHTIADEIFQTQLALRGVARTKIAFVSDRDGVRLTGTVESRVVKEIYICDYDGANQRRLTTNQTLNITPTWSPDARSIAYTSYRRGIPDIFISNIYQGTMETPLRSRGEENFLPVWSPDGTRIAFQSNRDGNAEIYVMNRDGSGIRRVTNHPMIDGTPTWSPSGNQIAFTSDRSGSPQIYVVDVDGLNLRLLTRESYCDRATWSPAPYNEIAYAARTGVGLRHRRARRRDAGAPAADVRRGQQREPGVRRERPPHRVQLDARRQDASSTRSNAPARTCRLLTRIGNNQMPDWSK